MSQSVIQSNNQPTGSQPNVIIISEKASQQLKQVTNGPDQFLRVEVEGGGCSGFQYKFKIDSKIDESQDVIFEKNGSKVVVDQTSLELINGSLVDYKQELIKASFVVINNPNAEHGCSCGASFTVKI